MVREVKKSGTAATSTTKALQRKAAISIATGGGKFPSLAGWEALPESGKLSRALGERSQNLGAPPIFWVSRPKAWPAPLASPSSSAHRSHLLAADGRLESNDEGDDAR